MDHLNRPAYIRALELSFKELSHCSRKRIGFHVYVTIACAFVKSLLLEDQERVRDFVLGLEPVEAFVPANLRDSFDSTDTVAVTLSRHEIWSVCCYFWSNVMSARAKLAWKRRAKALNRRHLPGLLIKVPVELDSTAIARSITNEWNQLVVKLRNATTRRPSRTLSSKIVYFGSERVQLRAQVFRTFALTDLLSVCVLGPNHCKLKESEIQVETKKQFTAYIASRRRAMEIFAMEGLCAVDFKYPQHNRSICGKVNIFKNGRNMIGYILDEDEDGMWQILMSSQEAIWLSNCDTAITEYWPIRLFVHSNGNVKMSFSRVCIDENNHIVFTHTY